MKLPRDISGSQTLKALERPAGAMILRFNTILNIRLDPSDLGPSLGNFQFELPVVDPLAGGEAGSSQQHLDLEGLLN